MHSRLVEISIGHRSADPSDLGTGIEATKADLETGKWRTIWKTLSNVIHQSNRYCVK